MVDHSNDLSQDLVASVIKFGEDLLSNIAVSKSNLDMDLGLGGFSLRVIKLRRKGSLVSPLSPRLCQIGAYRTRGSPNLIRQRVPLLDRKMLGQFENTHHQRHSSIVDVQFPKMLNAVHNSFFECTTPLLSEAPLPFIAREEKCFGVWAYGRVGVVEDMNLQLVKRESAMPTGGRSNLGGVTHAPEHPIPEQKAEPSPFAQTPTRPNADTVLLTPLRLAHSLREINDRVLCVAVQHLTILFVKEGVLNSGKTSSAPSLKHND
jgi:hypothetical protein